MKALHFTDKQSGDDISLAYSDYGKGQPVVLIHGWPSSKEMFEYNIAGIVNSGYRVIKYDRRGFGKSSKPWTGYDYDTLASDLNELIEQLQLDKVILVGFSMGGGEVIRYIARYGQSKLDRVVLLSSIIPYMLKTPDNREGVDQKVFDQMAADIKEDRMAFLDQFGKDFFGAGFLSKPLSDPLMQHFHQLAAVAPQHSTLACAQSFSTTDFRQDLTKVALPVLIIHGDSDKIVPLEASSERTAKLLPQAEYIVYQDAPHGLFYTHRDLLNQHLVDFFQGIKHQAPDPVTYIPTTF